MANQRSEKFNVVHESKRHEIVININENDEVTVQDLANAIQKNCHVPISKQKLICKGRSLYPQVPSTLKDLGVTSREKILLIGKKEIDEEIQQVKKIEKVSDNVDELRKKFEEKRLELNGIAQGFLSPDQGKESLQKLSRNIACISEGLMKHLETLDGFLLEKDFTEAREKRKALIVRIQKYLKEHDDEEERINGIVSRL